MDWTSNCSLGLPQRSRGNKIEDVEINRITWLGVDGGVPAEAKAEQEAMGRGVVRRDDAEDSRQVQTAAGTVDDCTRGFRAQATATIRLQKCKADVEVVKPRPVHESSDANHSHVLLFQTNCKTLVSSRDQISFKQIKIEKKKTEK